MNVYAVRDQAEWLAVGVHEGWCGPPVCATHDGVPTSAVEDELMEEYDSCLHIVRLYESNAQRDAVELNHAPSIWRQL